MFLKNIRLLYLFTFLKSLHFFGAVGLAFYLDWGKLDYTHIFILEAAFVFGVFVLEIPTGTVADKFGRKYSLVLGGLFNGIGFIVFGGTTSYAVFFVANLFCAAGLTLFSGADKALLYDSLLESGKAEEGRHYISRYEAFGTAGMLVGFPVGSFLAGSGLSEYPRSMAICFQLSGIFYLLAGGVALFLHEPERKEKLKDPLREGIAGLRLVFSRVKLRGYAFNFAAVSSVSFFVFWFYQTLIRLAGLPIAVNGFVAAGFNLAGLLLLWNVRSLEKRFTLDRTLLLTAVLPGACFLLLASCIGHAAVTLILVYVLASAKLLRGPLLSDLMNREIESRNRATVLSGVSMLERGLTGILYIPVGFLADKSLSVTFICLGIIALIGAFLSRIRKVR